MNKEIWLVKVFEEGKKKGRKKEGLKYTEEKCKITNIDRYGDFCHVEILNTGQIKMFYLSQIYDNNEIDARKKLGYSKEILGKSGGKKIETKNIEYLEEVTEQEIEVF